MIQSQFRNLFHKKAQMKELSLIHAENYTRKKLKSKTKLRRFEIFFHK